MHGVWRALQSDRTVHAACAASLALGLFFIFVWAPHPWGWEGFDHYHELALELAAGRPFPTLEVPWGYAYFVAAFYRLFGDRPAVVLIVQALLNATIQWLVYRFASTWTDRRTAVGAAALAGVFSFNTVYASTQSSDSVCTVIFMTALVAFAAARQSGRLVLFASVGLLTGVAAQFRPNLIIVPPCLAAFAWLESRDWRRALQSLVLLLFAGAALTPWVARNYRLTHMLLPTSVHGGVQLWYGTLQVGPYLHSRAYNPRSVFEASAFDYTSLDGVPVVVQAAFHCTERPLADAVLSYRENDDGVERRVAASHIDGRSYTFEIAPRRAPAVIRYYLTASWTDSAGTIIRTTPRLGDRAPLVYFVTRDHLGDADAAGDLLDIFDVIRLMRREAWGEPVPFDDRLRAAGIVDVRAAGAALLRPVLSAAAEHSVSSLDSDAGEARLLFADRSRIVVPRSWHGRITEIFVAEGIASTVMTSHRSLLELTALRTAPPVRPPPLDACLQSVAVEVNQVFYRREPHMMRRYAALALDNIARDPAAFLLACAYRAVRVFIVEGAADAPTAHQFTQSSRIYGLASALAAVMLVLCAAGIAIAWRRGDAIGLPLLLILSVPATLAPVLINMRYTVTIQPLMLTFVAVALTRFSSE
jgi:hypothetical protein